MKIISIVSGPLQQTIQYELAKKDGKEIGSRKFPAATTKKEIEKALTAMEKTLPKQPDPNDSKALEEARKAAAERQKEADAKKQAEAERLAAEKAEKAAQAKAAAKAKAAKPAPAKNPAAKKSESTPKLNTRKRK